MKRLARNITILFTVCFTVGLVATSFAEENKSIEDNLVELSKVFDEVSQLVIKANNLQSYFLARSECYSDLDEYLDTERTRACIARAKKYFNINNVTKEKSN